MSINNNNPLRSLTSLKNTPTYKPLPRRVHTNAVEAPWLASGSSTSTTTTTTTITTPSSSSTTIPPSQQQPQSAALTIVQLDSNYDDDMDQDENFDPFAQAGAKGGVLGVDNYSDDDNDDEDDEGEDDDSDDEEAQLRRALKQIQQEREREKEAQMKVEVKAEMVKSEGGVEKVIDKRLLSNPLLANKMAHLIKAEIDGNGDDEHTTVWGSDVKREDGMGMGVGGGDGAPTGPVKRKKWTSDSLFSNTALSLGDSNNDHNKKQKLNNDTINSDTHVDFMKAIFK